MSIVVSIGKQSFHAHWLAIAVVLLFGSVFGFSNTGNKVSAAYSNNPKGYADSCSIAGNQTIIYGWGYDPQAPAGAQPYVMLNVTNAAALGNLPTDIVYRQSTLNSELSSSYPGAPLPGTYGWKAIFTNLYQGTAYSLSGTVLNYGVGANASLGINTTHNVDGDTSKPYFIGGKIPDVCLTPRPAPTPPPPAPKPPTPTPRPATTAATSTAPTPSNAMDGVVTVGTTGAIIRVPAGSATSVHLLYGKEPIESTPDQPTNGADTSITLNNLTPKTTYSYKIVRTLGTQTTTSDTGSFTTNGFSISLVFTNKDKKPVQGIAVQLNNSKLTSDKDGTVQFDDLSSGTYTARFTYKGTPYFQEVSVVASGDSEAGTTISANKTINLDGLKQNASAQGRGAKSSGLKTGLLIFVGLAVLIGLVVAGWLASKLLSTRLAVRHSNRPRHTDIIDQQSIVEFNQQNAANGPMPHNVGVSLKDMVLQSMHEDAAKQRPRDDQQPPQWPAP